ncbi:MAG: protein phosphatase 2C domain-containing protein [Eubacteriales bacterium]|nr:protein phosphatase 2C domain-containing protein [Eubacteriales bacterium]MDD3200124.1 protein phosphatase 2C domain-containing protein [Eubacteriales bacterium]MDD4630391.1 protein phosphatase 2C domain-containing protein [Eubacteriales bacterium]
MTIYQIEQFAYSFRAAGLADIGRQRKDNQDEVILCPELGFFAVSDGMGGLLSGGKASQYVRQAIPQLIKMSVGEYARQGNLQIAAADISKAAAALRGAVQTMSDALYRSGNSPKRIIYGSTLAGVWLVGNQAIFVNLGDSRGYLLGRYRKNIRQITEDHNIAALLVQNGQLTREAAREHESSSRLTAFVGMPQPAEPEVFSVEVQRGDRILLCSDGLYSMAEEKKIAQILRSSRSPERVCQRLIGEANERGGRDNISAVYIKILT